MATVLTREAGSVLPNGLGSLFEALHVYGSFDPNKPADARFKHWFSNWLEGNQASTSRWLSARKRRAFQSVPLARERFQTVQAAVPTCEGPRRKVSIRAL